MIYIGNLVDALLICINHPKAAEKTYLLSDGKDISTSELIQMISYALGRRTRLFPCPQGLLRLLAKVAGKSKNASRLLDSLIVDSSKIRTELDWTPPYSMEEGLEKTAKWYLQAFK